MSEFETPADDVQQLPEAAAPVVRGLEEPADDVPPGLEVPEPVPAPPATGDEAVDAALGALAGAMGDAPLEGQVAAFESAHRALQDRLADVEG